MKLPITTLDKNPAMRPYYIVIGIMSLIVIVVVGISLFGNASLKHDYKLEQKVNDIQTKMNSYISAQKKLPDILPDIGIQDSEGVEYKKVSDNRYVLCATFQSKSDGYVITTVEPGLAVDLKEGASLSSDTKFTNGDTEGLKHDEGYTCFYYEPYQLKDEYTKPYTFCGVRYKNEYASMTITAIDTANNKLTVNNINGYYPISSTEGSTDPGIGTDAIYRVPPTKRLPETSVITITAPALYNSSCQSVGLSTLTVGGFVNLYFDDSVSTPERVEVL